MNQSIMGVGKVCFGRCHVFWKMGGLLFLNFFFFLTFWKALKIKEKYLRNNVLEFSRIFKDSYI